MQGSIVIVIVIVMVIVMVMVIVIVIVMVIVIVIFHKIPGYMVPISAIWVVLKIYI